MLTTLAVIILVVMLVNFIESERGNKTRDEEKELHELCRREGIGRDELLTDEDIHHMDHRNDKPVSTMTHCVCPAVPKRIVADPSKSLATYHQTKQMINELANTSATDIPFEAVGLGILAGIGGWFGAWLLIVSIAFIWWFILDRIRELARAIKGQP